MFFQIENISFKFPGESNLLENLSLTLDKKKVYALMGINGSGKTTLFNVINGFHKPQSGKIIFKGQDITALPPYKVNEIGIGRTFQDLRLISKLSVRENILLAMKHNPTDNWARALLPSRIFEEDLNRLDNKVVKIIADCFLQEVQHSMAHEISFGQQKLLTLACCLANGADLLLLDEPVAGISPSFKEQITILIKNLKRNGKTILMIEHDTDFTAETADSYLFLSGGSLSESNNFVKLKMGKATVDDYF